MLRKKSDVKYEIVIREHQIFCFMMLKSSQRGYFELFLLEYLKEEEK
ncbi:MAG: hypothetical protein OSJ60_17390 [Lachnospiraceae bacterium]|nr:hypothetical protein [Lachnospiraceae bacterium]